MNDIKSARGCGSEAIASTLSFSFGKAFMDPKKTAQHYHDIEWQRLGMDQPGRKMGSIWKCFNVSSGNYNNEEFLQISNLVAKGKFNIIQSKLLNFTETTKANIPRVN
jgi:hypothetical protein